MENQDPEREINSGRLLDSRKKIQTKNLSLKNKLPIQRRDDKSLVEESDDSANYSKTNKNSASTSSLGNSNVDNLTEENDSLCDFRSPVKDNHLTESLADFEVKPTVLKSNKRLGRKESKSVVSKKRRNRDALSNVKQPSIESSFFKSRTTVKTAFLCPLCFKSYKDATAQHNHMKSCAAKNKISTNKLLDAVQLQEKQANERRALGLLAAPPIQPKKTVSRKLISEKDTQLQLALALSMSLYEAQVSEEIEDAHLLVGETYLPINSAMSEERRKTLQNFGFTTNKPATASTSGKSRKKRRAGPTALQIRTQEERDRLLTVRIAEVLMGDEAVTQALLENVEKVMKSEENIILKSRLLRSYHRVKDRLWEKSQQCLSGRNPYSCNLFGISTCEVKSEPEMKEPEQGTSKVETPIQDANNMAEIVDGNSSSTPIKLERASKSSVTENRKATVVKYKTDKDSIMNLFNDWKCMLGVSYMSDVLVIVKGNFQIHAHQVVFLARCCDILKDVTRRDPERFWEMQQIILWPETDALSAEAFLEYVYCGVIDRCVSIFENPDMLAGVRVLARKYRLKKLFAYLSDKSLELKSEKDGISDQRLSKAKPNLESNTSSDNSSCLSKEESSITSVETNINSVSTACSDLMSNKPVIDERSSDSVNVARTNLKSMNVEEKENISHNLVVDYFSSSNDSFIKQIPRTATSSTTIREKLSGREIDETISTTVATGLAKTTDIESLTLSQNSTNHDAVHNNDNNIKIINRTLEEERCTSPDIFDDSTTDADVEVVSTSSRNLLLGSQDLNKEYDKTTDISQENKCRKSKKPEIGCPFVSVRRKGRSFKPASANVGNLNLEPDNLEREKKVSRSFLKQKGDITMAIERIQRLNAKTASESDSECELVETLPMKKHKNPFRINIADTSSMIEKIVQGDRDSESDDEIPSKKRNKLSIFEKKIEIEAAKNPAMFNLTSYKPESDHTSKKRQSTDSLNFSTSSSELQNVKLDQQQNKVEIETRIEPLQRRFSKPDHTIDTIFDLTQDSSKESKLDNDEESYDTDIEDKDLSMFTKYKRKHSHNSINKYRAALKKLSSQTSVSSIEDNEALSSNDLLSSNDELWDTSNKLKRNSFSSKYGYTDPDQSTSNFHRELSTNMLLKGKEQIQVEPESLSSESDDREASPVKIDDLELSDLEIDLSDFSGANTLNTSGNNRVDSKTQGPSTSKSKSDSRIFYDKQEVDSLTDRKLDVTELTIMKNDCQTKKHNISDQDTDTECCIESISDLKQSKTIDKMKSQSDADEGKLSDIYNEETDTGEMEDKNYQPRASCSKIKLDTMLDVVSKERTKSRSVDNDLCEISSPECEISGIFSPPSSNFDHISNVTNEVENLLDECGISSQKFRNLQMNLDRYTPLATTSNSLVSASTPQKPRDDYNSINLLNEVSDSEFDDMEFTVSHDYSQINCPRNKPFHAQSLEVEKRGKTINEKSDKNSYYVLESDSSDSGCSNIHKTKSSGSISLVNRSKAIRKRSIQSRCDGIVPKEKSSRSSLRSFKAKSVSENIIKTKSKRGANIMDDSFDGELARVQTPPIQEQDTNGNNDQTTPQQRAPSENVTPLANYSAMKTPELRKELQKYGLKAQKRHRAKQLLRYIYNELHPLVPVGDKNIASYSNESSSEDETPPPKRLSRSYSLEPINSRKNTDNIDSDCRTLASDTRTVSDASNDNDGLENNDLHTSSQSDNSEGLENTFRKLIEVDKSLYNKILAYEPLMLEELHATLKAQGLKCKLTALMDFLDEQCITFRTMANAKKSRTRRKASPKKNQGTQ